MNATYLKSCISSVRELADQAEYARELEEVLEFAEAALATALAATPATPATPRPEPLGELADGMGLLEALEAAHLNMVMLPAAVPITTDANELLALQGHVARFSMEWHKALPALRAAVAATARPTAPAATAGAWVAVTEALPVFEEGENSIECVVLAGGRRVATATYARRIHNSTKNGRKPRWERNQRLYVGATITHWQPLPLAPAPDATR